MIPSKRAICNFYFQFWPIAAKSPGMINFRSTTIALRRCYSIGNNRQKPSNFIKNIPNLREFAQIKYENNEAKEEEILLVPPMHPPYLNNNASFASTRKKVYIETYGCQMNTNDTEIVLAVLEKAGGFVRCSKDESISDADVILLMTCAIREGAETRIWHRLSELRHDIIGKRGNLKSVRFGILGCMAERLKETLLRQDSSVKGRPPVHLVCGPDAYRDLPRLLSQLDENKGQRAINVMLSLDETYADVMPVRLDPESSTSFVSIMRGCDNMCSYCKK